MPRNHPTPVDGSGPHFRSAAVARMAQMPVATLRIWEQRYGAVQPVTAASGHRLYSPADVQRVLLLRQLTEQGHAIGSIAALNARQLRQVADGAGRGGTRAPARRAAAGRMAVVGPALAARLQRLPAGRLGAAEVFGSLDEAAARQGAALELLLVHLPELRPADADALLAGLQAARQACGARQVVVLYRFGAAALRRALGDAGLQAVREPADDEALGRWLATVQAPPPARPAPREKATARGAPAPRRYDDATLTAIAGLSPTLACECPRHVAELLMQLASFEAYSAGCVHRDADDAALHAYLQQVAGTSRALFEAALERLARHEGLQLP
jgi:DNA-binding transcriptional MerR regulator